MDLRTNASASDRPTARVRGLSAWTMAFPLAVLAMAPFLPVVDNGFVNLDDHANFLDNPHYRGLGRPQIAWAWTTDWLGVYQPLAWMLFEVQYAAFGFDARGYHLTSLVLHALSGVALYSLSLALVGRACPDLRARNPTRVVRVRGWSSRCSWCIRFGSRSWRGPPASLTSRVLRWQYWRSART